MGNLLGTHERCGDCHDGHDHNPHYS
jgi:hypothetical protein